MEGKVQTIFLPDEEQTAQMIENAWQEFVKHGHEAGYEFNEHTADSWLKDVFVAGWTYGWNDGYGLIRGQIEAINLESET